MLVEKKGAGLFCESDEALRSKFAQAGFGLPGQENLLHPLEAAYLAQQKHTSFQSQTLQQFLKRASKKDKLFAFAFKVYSLIRKKGRIVRPYSGSSKYLRVYSPGVGREEERPSQLVCLAPGKFPSKKSLEEEVRVAHLARLELIVACGSQNEPKFYKVSAFNF
ncbi:MAG: hypothetical protein N3F07_00735 [Candidatus Micrarchaeota archaeon]|nr:hypothetical protein [Candidatus Micrarchaeota archaeon]